VPIFGAKECIRMQDLFKSKKYVKYTTKNFEGRGPGTSAAEGDAFVRTHPRAHLPEAGAPPLLLGWLRPCLCDATKLHVISYGDPVVYW